MIEQAIHTVQSTGKALQPAFPKTKDSVSAYEKIEGRRQSKKLDDEAGFQSHFKIEKSFTPSSKALARTLGNFQKVLDFLETDPNDHAQENTKTFSNEKTAQNAVPLLPQNQEDQNKVGPNTGAEKNLEKNNASNIISQTGDEQLEFDLFPKEVEKTSASIEIKKFNIEPHTVSDIKQEPDIHLGNNPTDFKIHNIITDEIIKAISNSNREIDIKSINESIANSLANHVRKLLEKQPHAIASDENSAPVKAFERTV